MQALPHRPEPASLATVAAVTLILAALAWLSLQTTRLPAPPASAAPDAFLAARARPDLLQLARAPRPIASAANAQARAHILTRLAALGVEHEVQSASAQKTTFISLGLNHKYDVAVGISNNVVARIKGTAIDRGRRPALLIASHYDSAPDMLGASDGAAAVAAMLETIRALGQGAPPENDVIFLFADGEKVGSLGARAFVAQHPWARKVGLVLQFDGAGNRGPMLIVGSRGGDGILVRGWAASAPRPLGSSVLPLFAAITPGLLEAGPLDKLGMAGLRLSNIEEAIGTEGGLDIAARADQRTLQHSGETMLALARHFGSAPLGNIASADRIHFDLPVLGQVGYAGELAWLLTLLTGFVFLVVCGLAVHRSGMALRMMGAGALCYVAIAIAMPIAAITLWQEFPRMHATYQPLASGAGARDSWYVLAYMTLGIAVFIEAQRRLHKIIGLPATVLGAMLTLLLLLLVTTALAPGASYLLAWPLLAALLAYGALYQPRAATLGRLPRMLILLAGAAPAVLLLTPLIALLATLYTPQHSALLMLALTALLGMSGALMANLRRRVVAPLLVLACAGALSTASALPQYDGALARANRMVYLKDSYSWKAWWLLPDGPLDDWARPYFGNTGGGPRALRDVFGRGQEERWVAPAERNAIAFPAPATSRTRA